MAKKLSKQKREAYICPPKACPAPADYRRFPELMMAVRSEWRSRMNYCRNWKKRPK
jgi:hypothetical protein